MINKEFYNLINTKNPILVSITSRYCDPCFLQKAILEKVHKIIGKKMSMITIDADDFPELTVKYEAIARPALLLFNNGELIWEQKDILSSHQIIKIVTNSIK